MQSQQQERQHPRDTGARLDEREPARAGRKRLRVKKSTLIIAGVAYIALCAGILAFANVARSAEGLWVRNEDDSYLSGMVVEIRKGDSGLEGVIVGIGERTHPFSVGQVKWTNIQKKGIGKYTLHDLSHEYLTDSFDYNDAESIMTVSVDGSMTLVGSQYDKGQYFTGAYQTWTKRGN